MPDRLSAEASLRPIAGANDLPKVAEHSLDDSKHDKKLQRSASRANGSTKRSASECPILAEISTQNGLEQTSVDLESYLSRRQSETVVVKDLNGNVLDLKKLAALSPPHFEQQPGNLKIEHPDLIIRKSMFFVCECCPERPRKFHTEEKLRGNQNDRTPAHAVRRTLKPKTADSNISSLFIRADGRPRRLSSKGRINEYSGFLKDAQVKRLAQERELATGVIEERHSTKTDVVRNCEESEETSTAASTTVVRGSTLFLYGSALDVPAPARTGPKHVFSERFDKNEDMKEVAAGGITSVPPSPSAGFELAEEMSGDATDDWSHYSPVEKRKNYKSINVASVHEDQDDEKEERSVPTIFHKVASDDTSKRNTGDEVAISIKIDDESIVEDGSNVDYFNDWAKTVERSTAPYDASFEKTSTKNPGHGGRSPSELPLFDSLQPGYEPTTTPETPNTLRCDIYGCEAVYLGGDRRADLMRHKRQSHQGFYSQYVCGDDDCGRVFRTLEARLQHYESDHPYIAAELSSRLQMLSTLISRDPAADVSNDQTSLSEVQDDMPEPFWYCCACGGGPHQHADLDCSDCVHTHCTSCQAVTQSYPYSYANLPRKTALDASDTNSRGKSEVSRSRTNSWPMQESRCFSFGDDENNSSAASSYAASLVSVFSVESLASSASEFSKASGYSAIQIATAAKVLMSIFHEDEVLLPLYQSAITTPSIGHDRLERNLRRLLKAYAKQVESEAGDHLEYLASQLVLVKARWLARSIVEKLQTKPVNERIHTVERDDESSEDEAESRPVDEGAFEDLVILREFLTKSHAFEYLRAQVHAFVFPKNPVLPHIEKPRQEEHEFALSGNTKPGWPACDKGTATLRSWEKWQTDVVDTIDAYLCNRDKLQTSTAPLYLLTDAMILVTDSIMIAVGILERPLQPEKVRLRWACACGETHYSDVKELRDSGIAELIAHMERSSGVRVSASPYRQHTGNQQYVAPRPGRWLRNGFAKFTSVFGNSKPSSCLPQHTNTCSSSVSTASSTTIPQPSMLHLLACMHHNRFRKVLQQDRIETIKTDRALLCFMRRQHARYRGRLLKFLSLKGVQGIFFVKFRLPLGGSVDVRHHDPCCLTVSTATQTGCECIPPKGKVEPSPAAEYRCIPGPPATYPPVPPEYLKSLFMCPTNVHEQDTWILDQLPKRICGELQGRAGQPADGWGIYYQEGWDFDVIILLVFVIFVLASLLLGVLWSRFQYDLQGAFGVSAYMITASGILVAVFASRVGKMG